MSVTPGDIVRQMDEVIWDDLNNREQTWTLDDRWKLVDGAYGLTDHGQAVIEYRNSHIKCLIRHEIEILFEIALEVPRPWGAAVSVALEVLESNGMIHRGILTEFGAECVREITRRGDAPFSRALVVEEKHGTRYFLAENEEQLYAAALEVYNDRWERGWYEYPIFESSSPDGKRAWAYLQENTGTVDGECISLKKLENIRS